MLLHHLLRAETTNRQELARSTGLSPATVNTLVNDLLRRGLIIETGMEDSSGGRPTTMFSMNPAYGRCIGIDCSETYLHFELFDMRLRNLATHEIPITPRQIQAEQVVAAMVDGLQTLLTESNMARETIVGVGVSIHGPFDHDTGVSVFAPYWGWHDVPMRELLEAAIDLPLYLDNPLKFNAIAELWLGAGRGVDSFASVLLGTGVGAGIILDGTLYRGASNSAGEWGHTPFVYNGRRCRCGSRGCLEAYIGAPGLIQTLREAAPTASYLDADDDGAIIRQLADGLQRGEPIAVEVCGEYAQMLGAGLATLVNIINPKKVILGSWLAQAIGAPILPAVQDAMARHAVAKSARSTPVVLSGFARSPVSIGGAALALEQFLNDVTDTNTSAQQKV